MNLNIPLSCLTASISEDGQATLQSDSSHHSGQGGCQEQPLDRFALILSTFYFFSPFFCFCKYGHINSIQIQCFFSPFSFLKILFRVPVSPRPSPRELWPPNLTFLLEGRDPKLLFGNSTGLLTEGWGGRTSTSTCDEVMEPVWTSQQEIY